MQRREFLKLSALGAGAWPSREAVPPRRSGLPGTPRRCGASTRSARAASGGAASWPTRWATGSTRWRLRGQPQEPGQALPPGPGHAPDHLRPDRLKRPLIRVEGSQRGEGKYRVATWEEALDYVAKRMLEIREKYGLRPWPFSATAPGTPGLWTSFLPPGEAPTPPSPRWPYAPLPGRWPPSGSSVGP